MSVANRARIEAYIGASGSGKGVSINRRLDELKPRRLLIWDPRAEYAKRAPAMSMAAIVEGLARARGGPFAARFVPGGRTDMGEAFGTLCRAAFHFGNVLLLAEELSDVTKPSWAPPAWRQITTQGRHKGLHVIGAAQRPALIDKTFLGNCTRIRCGAMMYSDDEIAMAKVLRVTVDKVMDLASRRREGGGVELTMIEFDRDEMRRERVTLRVSAAGRWTEKRERIP